MASPAREEKPKQAYEGLGAGGKFRKTPFRRTTQTTPYDRPPATLRNPSAASDGWLSKLVDPAQRLISASAHRLFSSVFRKRLPPPQSHSKGVNHEAKMKDKEEVTMDLPGVLKGTIDQRSNPSTSDDGGELTELEKILEQKTFTRSEIDRLTALLHSRTVDMPIENLEKRSEGIPSKSVVSHDRKEEFPKTPFLDKNEIDSRLASNPVVSTSVLDEGVASPAELAKAYMGNRPSKVSPSMLGLDSQTHHEDSPILGSLPFPSKLPMMSFVPRNSGSGMAPQNGFVTPRSRGRSAMYSMARTPYSRVPTTSTLQSAGSTVDAYGGALSSQSAWEQSQPSRSKQGASNHRFSVLDNDIGSVGPIRRIRQKPNLLSSRGLNSPVPSSTSILGARMSSEAAQNLWKPLSLGEPKHKALSENGDIAGPSTSFSTVPSKSSEMASKILEQLDKLVSPKEKSSEPNLHTVRDKSPTKLSPSMLHGQALKSLEDVDSPKFLDSAHKKNNNCNSKLDVSADHVIPDARDFTSQKQDKVRENGPLRIGAFSDTSTVLINGANSTTEKKDILLNVKTAVSAASNSVHPPQKKQAFKMSAHEDFLDLDDDDDSNGVASDSSGKAEVSSTKKTPVYSEVKTSASPSVSSSSLTVLPNAVATQPSFTYDKVDISKESHAGLPTFNYGGNVTSVKDSDAATHLFKFGSKSVDKVALPQSTFTSSPAVAESVNVTFSHSNPESSSSVHAVVSGATTSVVQPHMSGEAVNKSNSNAGDSFVIPKTTVSSAPSTTGIVSFGTPSDNSNIINGSSPPFTSSAPSVFSNLTRPNSSGSMSLTGNTNSVDIASTAVIANSSNGSSLAQAPSFSTAPAVKFESSTASTAVTPVPLNSPLQSFEGKNKESFGGKNTEDKGFGNLSSTSFAGTSTGISSAANQFQGSLFGTGSESAPFAQASSTATLIASVAQSSSTEPGSSASSLSHGFAGNTAFSTGSSIFAPTSTAKLPSSGTGTALGSSTSSLEGNSISSSSAPSVFASSWQSANSPVFATTFNSTSSSTGFPYVASSAASATNSAPIVSGGSSTAAATSTNSVPFLFGVSSTAAATTNSVPFVFGGSSSAAATTISAPNTFGGSTASSTNNNSGSMFRSSNGASSTSMFSFASIAPTSAPSQPPFGNSDPVFPFGSPGSNDQMNMEDSMAEDTTQASTPTAPGFGQQVHFGQQPVLNSQSASVFGGTPTPTAPAASPFQFAGQHNLTNPQNANPFQASGSLGANQGLGGSFSVGSSGGDGDKSHRRIIKVKHNRPRKK